MTHTQLKYLSGEVKVDNRYASNRNMIPAQETYSLNGTMGVSRRQVG